MWLLTLCVVQFSSPLKNKSVLGWNSLEKCLDELLFCVVSVCVLKRFVFCVDKYFVVLVLSC